jgi:LPXTG-motif cell wall-anchored protein
MLAGVLALVLAGLGVGGAGASRTGGDSDWRHSSPHTCYCSTTSYATSTTYPQTTTTYPQTTTIPTTPSLPHTGSSPLPLMWFGLVLILSGMGLTVRRPRARA